MRAYKGNSINSGIGLWDQKLNEPDLVGADPSLCQPDLKSVQVNLEIIKTSNFYLKNWKCWHKWWHKWWQNENQ